MTFNNPPNRGPRCPQNHPVYPRMTRLAIGWLSLALWTLMSGCSLSGVEDIDIARFEGLINNEKGLLIVDNRTTLEYASGRIPGSVHIPPEEFPRLASLLPADKDRPIVFYCRGYG